MFKVADKVAATRRDLAELSKRIRDKEAILSDIELPLQEEANNNGSNATKRRLVFRRFCAQSQIWQEGRVELDDAIFHRDMQQAELDGLQARFSAQRHAADLIAATLNASCE